jgi:hypothetical protein
MGNPGPTDPGARNILPVSQLRGEIVGSILLKASNALPALKSLTSPAQFVNTPYQVKSWLLKGTWFFFLKHTRDLRISCEFISLKADLKLTEKK